MSDKASGKEPGNRMHDNDNDDDVTMPVGAEVPVDPEAGDQLDIVDRWWDERENEKETRTEGREKPNVLDDIELPSLRRESLKVDDAVPEGPLDLPPLEEVEEAQESEELVDEGSLVESEPKEKIGVDAAEPEAAIEAVAPEEEGVALDEENEESDMVEVAEPEEETDIEWAESELEEVEQSETEDPEKEAVPEEPEPEPEEIETSRSESPVPVLGKAKVAEPDETDEAEDEYETVVELARPRKLIVPGATPIVGLLDDDDTEEEDEVEDQVEGDNLQSLDESLEENDSNKIGEDDAGDEDSEQESISENVDDGEVVDHSREEDTGQSSAEEDTPGKDEEPDDGDSELDDIFSGKKADFAAVPNRVQKKSKRKSGCWTVFTTLFFFGTLLLIGAIGVVGFIGYQKFQNAEEEIKALAEAKLAKEGIHLDCEGWRLNRFPLSLGIECLTIYETEAKEKPQLSVSDVAVNVDFIGLIKDQKVSGETEIVFNDSTVTFFEDGEQVGELTELDAEMLVSRERIVIERLETALGAVDVKGEANIKLPEAGPGSGGEESGAAEQGASSLDFDFSAIQKFMPFLEFKIYGDSPKLDLELDFDSAKPEEIDLVARFDGSNFSWRDLSVSTATIRASFDPATKRIEVPTLQIGYGEGVIGGVLSFDTETKILHVKQLQSTVDLIALLSEIKPELGDSFGAMSMIDSPMVQVSGTVPMEAPENAELAINYEHHHGIVITSSSRELPVSNLRGIVNYSGGTLQTDSFSASVLGGNVELNGAKRLTAGEKPFSGLIEVKGMPLAEIATYFGKADLGMTGAIYLDFRGVGYGDVKRIRGGGKVLIRDSKLPDFPIIGPVQKLLGTVIPAFGIRGEGSLTGSYLIESGVLLTSDMVVKQGGAELVTNGSIKLEHQSCDFTSVATLQPALAKATGLEGKSITIRGDGLISDPDLELKEFHLDFASSKLSEVLGTSPESLQKLKGMLGDNEQAAKILGAEIEEATGLELGDEIDSLINGFLGGAPSEGVEEESNSEDQ